MAEFDLIRRYFSDKKWTAIQSQAKPLISNGDDCAVLLPDGTNSLAVSIDTLIAGVHFPVTTNAHDIAYKALAVNLSDLSAMGAIPAWFLLALTIPNDDVEWLREFSDGLYQAAQLYHCPLIGGDTTKGNLSLTIQIAGHIHPGHVLSRSGAMLGDDVYVSGYLGEAAAGLWQLQSSSSNLHEPLLKRLNQPQPRLALGQRIASLATACIDVSDGLVADLGHICSGSQLGARIFMDRLLVSRSLQEHFSLEVIHNFILSGGDDYELCFTAPAVHGEQIQTIASQMNLPLTKIGVISSGKTVNCEFGDGTVRAVVDPSCVKAANNAESSDSPTDVLPSGGYNHFE